jgi:ubiquinone/menaquinone biosynthesis C-methylase UbiE
VYNCIQDNFPQQMTQKTKKTYNKFAHIYDQDFNPHLILEYDDVVRLVDAKKGDKILDAACGTGRYTEEFFLRKAKVVGIDFSKEMIKIAQQKNPKIDFRIADLTKKLPLPNNCLDKINCGQAMKHIKNLHFTLKEFHRILKKKGRFTFSVTHPDMDWTDYKMRNEENLLGSFIALDLREISDVFQYRFCDYFDAIDCAGFKIDTVKQVKIDKRIKHMLTPSSYRKVKGRFENVIFRLMKT